MHENDITLKSLLRRGSETLLALTNLPVEKWHNIELPEVRNRRADLLGETGDGRILHIELQSTNDSTMALRMMEYCAAIYRQFGRFPEQTVLSWAKLPGDAIGPERSAFVVCLPNGGHSRTRRGAIGFSH